MAVKGYRSQVDQMAGRSADQAVAYLSEFFARQGGIPREKVVRAKRADGEDPPACLYGGNNEAEA